MEVLLVILGIIWVIISASQKKSKAAQNQAAQEAAKRQQILQNIEAQKAAAAPYPPQPSAAPVRPTVQPSRPPVQRPQPQVQRPQQPIQSRHASPIQARTAETISSNLTQIGETKRHTLEASFVSGHAHEETSMTGVQRDCASSAGKVSVEAANSAAAPVTAPISAMGLCFDAQAVRNGIIYAEILEKPKALRNR